MRREQIDMKIESQGTYVLCFPGLLMVMHQLYVRSLEEVTYVMDNLLPPSYSLIIPYPPVYAGSHYPCYSLWAFISLAILSWPQSQTPDPHMDPCLCFGSCYFPLALFISGYKLKEIIFLTKPHLPLLPGRTAQSCRDKQGRK